MQKAPSKLANQPFSPIVRRNVSVTVTYMEIFFNFVVVVGIDMLTCSVVFDVMAYLDIVTHPPQIITLAPEVTKAPMTNINETKLVPNISNVQTSKQTNELSQVEIPSRNNTDNQTDKADTEKRENEARVDISDDAVKIILIGERKYSIV